MGLKGEDWHILPLIYQHLIILWLCLCAEEKKGESHAKQIITCTIISSFLFNLALVIVAPTKWIFFPSYIKALSPN